MAAVERPVADPYARLGLRPGASPADVRRAYRRLAMHVHPDHAGAGSLQAFLAAWNLVQFVGDRSGVIREPVVIDVEPDGTFHGFSGFGVSDSGGERWASSAATAPDETIAAAPTNPREAKAA